MWPGRFFYPPDEQQADDHRMTDAVHGGYGIAPEVAQPYVDTAPPEEGVHPQQAGPANCPPVSPPPGQHDGETCPVDHQATHREQQDNAETDEGYRGLPGRFTQRRR